MILQCDDIDNVLSFLTSLRSHCTSWPWSQWCSQFNQVLILSKSILTVNIKIHLNNQHPNPSKRSTSKSICTVNIWTVNIQIHLNGQQQSTSVNIQIHLSGQLIQIHRNRSYPNPSNRQLTKAFWPACSPSIGTSTQPSLGGSRDTGGGEEKSFGSRDTGDGNLCGCWPLSSSSRAPSEEDIPAQVSRNRRMRVLELELIQWWASVPNNSARL